MSTKPSQETEISPSLSDQREPFVIDGCQNRSGAADERNPVGLGGGCCGTGKYNPCKDFWCVTNPIQWLYLVEVLQDLSNLVLVGICGVPGLTRVLLSSALPERLPE
jgi:hypothetical protein